MNADEEGEERYSGRPWGGRPDGIDVRLLYARNEASAVTVNQ